MKEKTAFSVETDLISIEIDAVNAIINVREATDGTFRTEYPDTPNLNSASSGGNVILSQQKYPFCKWKRQVIDIFVPAHTVPDLKIRAKKCELNVQGGIYGELACALGDGSVSLKDAVFQSAEIAGGCVNAALSRVTVKSNLFLQIEKGDVLAENTFATRYDCNVRRGNIGLALVNCKDCAFNTDRGNITATIAGSEEKFNTTLITREGTLNREGAKHEGADGNFQAYADKGNIVLDFAEDRKPVPEITANLRAVPYADEAEKENA